MITCKLIELFDFRMPLYFKGIRIAKENDVSIDKIGKFRKKIYLESKYIEENKIPEVWIDEYDKEAINICATKGDEIISAIRLIPKNDIPLPIEKYFNLANSLPKNTFEISKAVVLKEYRGGSRLLFLALMQRVYRYAKANNIPGFVSFMPDWLANSTSKMGMKLFPLEQNPLSQKELDQRKEMQGYFQKQSITPYYSLA